MTPPANTCTTVVVTVYLLVYAVPGTIRREELPRIRGCMRRMGLRTAWSATLLALVPKQERAVIGSSSIYQFGG
jgi:hypothetical protein